MHKRHNKTTFLSRSIKTVTIVVLTGVLLLSMGTLFLTVALFSIDTQYKNRVYPSVIAEGTDLAGKTKADIVALWELKNQAYERATFELHMETHIATISGKELELGYDSELLAEQAYLIGRSGNLLSDILVKLTSQKTQLSPYFRWKQDAFNTMLADLTQTINTPPQDALFDFKNGRVTEFKPAIPGKRANREIALLQFQELLKDIPTSKQTIFPIHITVETVAPKVTTGKTNTLGIKERIGHGYSEFAGSIPGRIHNVALAASKFHGVLIPPGETFSYNETIGDISSTTGYQPAYIIKDGRTVLGDGGGVCQVSTTLFRAALNAGLPVLERTAHAYRVHYYEDGGFKPGLDATVFAPSVDLKIKNDTSSHILIQAYADTKKLTLSIDLFGTSDGRKAEITTPQILSQSAAPPPLYQDDPTLPKGTVKQIDWAAGGAKTIFSYKVTRGNETLQDKQFVSNYRPWQAVYLRGPQ